MRNFENFRNYVAKHKEANRCLIRVDLNLPSEVEDLSRIYSIRSTVLDILSMGMQAILISHYKRPPLGDFANRKFSLRGIAQKVSVVLDHPVEFIGGPLYDISPAALDSSLVLLENLRFYDGETKNDPEFAKQLSRFGDIYINDAFSVSHRKHASVSAITNYLPSFAGHSLEMEIENLSKVTSDLKRPYTAIIAGSKISSKIGVLRQLSQITDTLIIAGAMGNTFVAANGVNLQKSMIEPEQFAFAREIMEKTKAKIVLPVDALVSTNINEIGHNCAISDIRPGFSCFDLGSRTIETIIHQIEKSRTLLWNGALGAFEFSNFNESTKIIAKCIAERTNDGHLISIIGGGETAASIHAFKEQMTFVSTAGGAFLELVAGHELPGLAALGF